MNGNAAYEMQYENRINNLLLAKPELNGFYAYIGDSSLSTIYNYLGHISHFCDYIQKPIEEVTFDDFTKYIMSHRKTNTGNSSTSSYKIGIYHALKKFGKYLNAKGILDNNPMDYIDRPKSIESQKTIEKRENGYLSKKEISKYTKSVRIGAGSSRSKNRQKEWKERDMAIIILFLNTGLRCSALTKLDISSINFQEKTLVVTDKESKVNSYDLSDEVVNVLKKWLEKRKQLLGEITEEALFISNQRKRLHQNSVSKIVEKYAYNITGKHISPHKLRATYGTQLYDATGDIYFVQEQMHHNNPKTTELYIRGIKNNSKKASDIMASLTLK